MRLRPIDELLLGLAIWQLLELKRAGDMAKRAAKLAADAAADPSVLDRVVDVAVDKVIGRFLPFK